MAYRVLAWIVGVNLIVVFAGFFGKKLTDPGSFWHRHAQTFLVIDQVHGFLFMVLLVIIALLARQYRWSPGFTISTMLLATVPILSFWAEHRTTERLRQESAPAD